MASESLKITHVQGYQTSIKLMVIYVFLCATPWYNGIEAKYMKLWRQNR